MLLEFVIFMPAHEKWNISIDEIRNLWIRIYPPDIWAVIRASFLSRISFVDLFVPMNITLIIRLNEFKALKILF